MKKSIIHTPRYERFKPSLHYAYDSLRWIGRPKESISLAFEMSIKIKAYIFCVLDKVGYEHFDYVISGGDCLASLHVASELSDKGYRVLIYPSLPRMDGESMKTLVHAQAELWSPLISRWYCAKNRALTPGSEIQEVVAYYAKKCDKIDENGLPLVMMTNGEAYSIFEHWSTLFNGMNQLTLIDDIKVPNSGGMWDIANMYLNKFSQFSHVDEGGYFGVNDACITTFSSLILTTRTDQSINPNLNSTEVLRFGESETNIISRTEFTDLDRLKDIQKVNIWLRTVNDKGLQ